MCRNLISEAVERERLVTIAASCHIHVSSSPFFWRGKNSSTWSSSEGTNERNTEEPLFFFFLQQKWDIVAVDNFFYGRKCVSVNRNNHDYESNLCLIVVNMRSRCGSLIIWPAALTKAKMTFCQSLVPYPIRLITEVSKLCFKLPSSTASSGLN